MNPHQQIAQHIINQINSPQLTTRTAAPENTHTTQNQAYIIYTKIKPTILATILATITNNKVYLYNTTTITTATTTKAHNTHIIHLSNPNSIPETIKWITQTINTIN